MLDALVLQMLLISLPQPALPMERMLASYRLQDRQQKLVSETADRHARSCVSGEDVVVCAPRRGKGPYIGGQTEGADPRSANLRRGHSEAISMRLERCGVTIGQGANCAGGISLMRVSLREGALLMTGPRPADP